MDPKIDVWLLVGWFLLYCSVLAMLVEALLRSFPKFFKEHTWGMRLKHWLPLAMGAAGSFIPGAIPLVFPVPLFFIGILTGGFCGQVYAGVKRQFEVAEKIAEKRLKAELESIIEKGPTRPAVIPQPAVEDDIGGVEVAPSTPEIASDLKEPPKGT